MLHQAIKLRTWAAAAAASTAGAHYSSVEHRTGNCRVAEEDMLQHTQNHS